MVDLSSNPRLQELIQQAEDAVQLRGEIRKGHGATGPVQEALDDIWRDIGRLVHRLMMAADQGILDAQTGEEGDTSEDIDNGDIGRGDRWYTDEIQDDGKPLFDADDAIAQITDIPESDPITQEVPIGDPTYDDGGERATLADMAWQRGEAGEALHVLASGDEDPPWGLQLSHLMGLLTLPASFDDPDELAIEASRVQWAANELPNRLDGLPQAVRLCVLGMLAARAQHLRRHLDIDVGPRLALDRMRRYRLSGALPNVAGLRTLPEPERESWERDAVAWWELLQP